MNRNSLYDDDDDEEEDDIGVDMEDIRRACMISDTNSDEIGTKSDSIEPDGGGGGGIPSDSEEEDDFELLRSIKSQAASFTDAGFCGGPPMGLSLPSDSDSEDDFEMIRMIKRQLSLSVDACNPSLGLSDDDEDNDFETLRAIRRRFFDPKGNFLNDSPRKKKQVHALDNEPSSEILSRSNTCESFPDHEKSVVSVPVSEEVQDGHSVDVNEKTTSDHLESCQLSRMLAASSSFLESAQAIFDARRKNRAYQKFLRRKLEQIEATIEKNEKLKKNVLIIRDIQASCKRRTKQALTQRKDPLVQLISTQKCEPCGSSESEGNDKKTSPSPLTLGPLVNPCVANYRMALEKYPLSVDRKSWSNVENENLAKGVKEEVQSKLLHEAHEQLSDLEESTYATPEEIIQNLEITPELIRRFLHKISWDSMEIKDRSAAECKARWMSSEDPLINKGPWTEAEDKDLLRIIGEKSLTDWVDIAVTLGTNRTPFQCLARYQRSLNANILRKEWTAEEDDQLRAAVELYGDKDWQSVANALEGRAGTQCSNRWKKSLCPTIKGKWSSQEDKRLKVAVTLFGAKNWHKMAQFVPGRTAAQCRERWVNCLEPNVNRGKWTEEEDEKLREAIAKHGYSWSKVASDLSGRTDNQCSRRWKKLYPHQVPLLQEARRSRREAIVGNFVDRESERPAHVTGAILALPDIEPGPILALPDIEPGPISALPDIEPGPDNVLALKKRKAKQKKSDAERQPKRRRKESEKCSPDICRLENETVPNNGGEERLLELEWYNENQKYVKERKRRSISNSIEETSNNTSGLKKLKPRRRVSAVVPIEIQDAPN